MPRGNGDVKKKARGRKGLDFKMPIKALSTNKLYRGRRYRTSAYETYRKRIQKYLHDNFGPDYLDKRARPLALYLEVGFSSPLADVSNSVKGIEDVVTEYFGINDRNVIDIQLKKYLVNKGDEYVRFKLRGSKRKYDNRR